MLSNNKNFLPSVNLSRSYKYNKNRQFKLKKINKSIELDRKEYNNKLIKSWDKNLRPKIYLNTKNPNNFKKILKKINLFKKNKKPFNFMNIIHENKENNLKLELKRINKKLFENIKVIHSKKIKYNLIK